MKCPECDRELLVMRRRLPTMYTDNAMNYMVSCRACFVDKWDMYASYWLDAWPPQDIGPCPRDEEVSAAAHDAA
jgi:C4-type Zn-finger protein